MIILAISILIFLSLVSSRLPTPFTSIGDSNSRAKQSRVAYPVSEGIRIYEPPPFGCEPIQIRLAIGDKPNQIRVSWRTADTTCPSAASFGLANDALSLQSTMRRVTGKSTSYTRNDLCASPATDIDIGTIVTHSVVFTDLEPNRLYLYILDGEDATTSGSFLAPPPIAPSSSFTFITYMDQGEPHDLDVTASPGGGVTAQYALYEVQERSAALIFHMGDVAYANGESIVWDRYLSMIEGYARLVPYMIGPGNHETNYYLPPDENQSKMDASGTKYADLPFWAKNEGSGGECSVPYGKRFVMPSSSPKSNPPFWYSYDFGSVHFFVLSSEHAMDANAAQIKWLAADLASVDRCRTPWVIGGMHRPLYVSKNGDDKDIAALLRHDVEPILIQHRVNLMLYGHTHYYERGCPLQYGTCVKDVDGGILHLSIGTGGHIPTSDGGYWEPWKQYAEDEYGYGRVVVHTESKLTFEFIATADGLMHDSVDLFNSFDTKTCNSDSSGGRGVEVVMENQGRSSWLRALYQWIMNVVR